jgi:hypothetical protein
MRKQWTILVALQRCWLVSMCRKALASNSNDRPCDSSTNTRYASVATNHTIASSAFVTTILSVCHIIMVHEKGFRSFLSEY